MQPGSTGSSGAWGAGDGKRGARSGSHRRAGLAGIHHEIAGVRTIHGKRHAQHKIGVAGILDGEGARRTLGGKDRAEPHGTDAIRQRRARQRAIKDGDDGSERGECHICAAGCTKRVGGADDEMVGRTWAQAGERRTQRLIRVAIDGREDEAGVQRIGRAQAALEFGGRRQTQGVHNTVDRGGRGRHRGGDGGDGRGSGFVDVLLRDVRGLPVVIARLISDDADGSGPRHSELAAVEHGGAADNVAGRQAAAGAGGESDGVADGHLGRYAEAYGLRRAENRKHKVRHELIAPGESNGAIVGEAKAPKRAIDSSDQGVVGSLEGRKPASRGAHLCRA